MTNGFPTFNLGNVLTQAENIQGARDTRAQANALAQRNAQNQILLQQFLAGQPGGGPAGNVNALNQLALGAGVPAAQEAQEFVTQQREDQEREADENIRILDMLSGGSNIVSKFQLLFPERAEEIETAIVDAGGPSFDEMTNEQAQSLVDNIRTQLLPGASPELLKELGVPGRGVTGAFQNVIFPDGTRDQIRLNDPRLDAAQKQGAIIASNRDQLTQNALTKQTELFQAATGKLIPLTPEQAQAAAGIVPTQPTVPTAGAPVPQQDVPVPTSDITQGGLDIIELATGPFDALFALFEGIPLLSAFVEGGDIRRAKTGIALINRAVEGAIALNPRFPEGETARIRKILPKIGFFSTSTAAFEDFTALQNSLVALNETAKQDAADTTLAPSIRSAAQASSRALDLVISQIGEILQASNLSSPLIENQQQFDALNSGDLFRERGSDGKIRSFEKP